MVRRVELTVVATRPECLIGHAGPLSVCIWRGAPTADALRALAKAQERLIERHGRISALNVLRAIRRVERPSPELDALTVELATQVRPRCVGTATVIEATGVAAAIAHGARARVLPHVSTPDEAFPRVAEALAWIARLPGQDPALYAAPALAADVELLGRGDEG
jgi:hypothetical protein